MFLFYLGAGAELSCSPRLLLQEVEMWWKLRRAQSPTENEAGNPWLLLRQKLWLGFGGTGACGIGLVSTTVSLLSFLPS